MPSLWLSETWMPDSAICIWPRSEALVAGFIQETREYVLELRDAEDPDSWDLLFNDVPLSPLRSQGNRIARWLWKTDFYAGGMDFELRTHGRLAARGELVIDPATLKLTRSDFAAMVSELLENTLALFSLSGARTGVSASRGQRTLPIARLEFLRARIEDLESVVKAIASRPSRKLTRSSRLVHITQCRNVDCRQLPRRMASASTHLAAPIYRNIAGVGPSHLPVSEKHESVDLPENRAIKAALRSWQAWLTCFAQAISSVRYSDASQQEARSRVARARQCSQLAMRLESILNGDPWRDVSDTFVAVTASAVFRRHPDYNRFYQIYADMNRGIGQVTGDFLHLPLARTFDLYELWVFVRVVKAFAVVLGYDGTDLQRIFDSRSLSTGDIRLAEKPSVRLSQHLSLCFKREFREYWRSVDGCGSFSRTMIPDISVVRTTSSKETDGVVVLDAKYRVEAGLNEALASLHMYRDAIVIDGDGRRRGAVLGAYLVTPHVGTCEEGWRETNMPNRLFHPAYRSEFRLGAVTLRPAVSDDEVARLLKTVLAECGESL
jgi:predicted component of viral defense system (DUF524 family)